MVLIFILNGVTLQQLTDLYNCPFPISFSHMYYNTIQGGCEAIFGLKLQISPNCLTCMLTVTLVPEVFLFFFSDERTAKRRERKTSGYLGLESHFHADAGCQTRQTWTNGILICVFVKISTNQSPRVRS